MTLLLDILSCLPDFISHRPQPPPSPFGSLAGLLFSNILNNFFPEICGTSCFLFLQNFPGLAFLISFVSSFQLNMIFWEFYLTAQTNTPPNYSLSCFNSIIALITLCYCIAPHHSLSITPFYFSFTIYHCGLWMDWKNHHKYVSDKRLIFKICK